MNYNTSKKIYLKCKKANLTIKKVCEIGVYLPETSNILDFILENIPTILIEPDKKNIKSIERYFTNKTNIELFPVAIYDYNGTLELVQREASTFAANLEKSPAIVNDKYVRNNTHNFEVECKKFDEIDPKDIDLLSIDTEGCEWFVLKYMVSRPLVISIETHGKYYTNPYINEILNWIKTNNYSIWYKDKSDTVFYLKGSYKKSIFDFLNLSIYDLYLKSRRLKQLFQIKYFKI